MPTSLVFLWNLSFRHSCSNCVLQILLLHANMISMSYLAERERAKMATYHYLAKYVVFYHCLRNILQSTTLLELEFHKLKFGKLLKFPSFLKNGTWNLSFINSSSLYIKFNRLKIYCLHSFISMQTNID